MENNKSKYNVTEALEYIFGSDSELSELDDDDDCYGNGPDIHFHTDINVRIEEQEAVDQESGDECLVDEADNVPTDNQNVQKNQHVLHEDVDQESGDESAVDEADNVPTDNHNVQKNQHVCQPTT